MDLQRKQKSYYNFKQVNESMKAEQTTNLKLSK